MSCFYGGKPFLLFLIENKKKTNNKDGLGPSEVALQNNEKKPQINNNTKLKLLEGLGPSEVDINEKKALIMTTKPCVATHNFFWISKQQQVKP